MPELDEFDVYLAHASADKPIVRELAAALKQRGLTIWLDEINMIVGRSLRTRMDSGLSKAAFGVVVLRARANRLVMQP